ncbi:hypothetical protein [Gordonia sp. N1V]|uniref:hypothetical protein n=1 Tax=Gordonia sp. N1V TaxID=3034163 RepID=UPI0023E29D89|nr:hypothetical protein [Gordonia sp. N1V]MDF3284006.1 hypothetical protein [Gordonia sp. N1V]
MAFLLTLVGIMAVGFLLWRVFGSSLIDDDGTREPAAKRGPVGPDDDPEFLMDLDRRSRGTNGSDPDDHQH